MRIGAEGVEREARSESRDLFKLVDLLCGQFDLERLGAVSEQLNTMFRQRSGAQNWNSLRRWIAIAIQGQLISTWIRGAAAHVDLDASNDRHTVWVLCPRPGHCDLRQVLGAHFLRHLLQGSADLDLRFGRRQAHSSRGSSLLQLFRGLEQPTTHGSPRSYDVNQSRSVATIHDVV